MCDYSLQGLPAEGKCPECGREFTASSLVFDAMPFDRWPRWWNLPFVALTMFCAAATLAISNFFVIPWARSLTAMISILVLIGSAGSVYLFFRRLHRGAPGSLVFSDHTIAFVEHESTHCSLRWDVAPRYLVQRLRQGRWRLRLSTRVASVDVVVEGDRRFMAALRAEVKSRLGLRGVVG